MTMTKHIDPSWPEVLTDIHSKVEQMEKLRAAADKASDELDILVHEAVDEGERYQDIAKAAGRSVAWVQTCLRRLNVEGPRVRVMTARAAEARRLNEEERAARKRRRDAKAGELATTS